MSFLGQGQVQGQTTGLGSTISSIGSSLGMSDATPNVGFDSFYTTVLTIAVVVLILVLAFLGWTMSKQKETDNFPKLQTSCPDFWKIEKDGEKNYCIQPEQGKVNSGSADAVNNAPGFKDGKFDFANSGWSAGGNAVCAKKKWANSHGINWDTVTNANYC